MCAEGDNDEVARLLGPEGAPSAFPGRHEHHGAALAYDRRRTNESGVAAATLAGENRWGRGCAHSHL